MKQIIARLYIIIIVLLILLGLSYFSIEVIQSRNEYKKESQSVAEEIKLLIEKNWFKNKNFSNQSLNDQLSDMMSSDKNINSILIYSAEDGLEVISRYSDRSFLLNSFNHDDPNWNKVPEYSFGFFQKIDNYIVRKPLQITQKGYAFDVVYNILPKDKMLELLEYALKITAVFLVLTVIVIILFGLWKSKYTVKEYDDELFKPMGGTEGQFPQESPSLAQETADFTADSLDEPDSSLDSFDELEDLDDFKVGAGDKAVESDSMDSFDDLDDFDIGTDETGEELEELDDFSLATDEPVEENLEELDDFSLDFDEEESEPTDDSMESVEEPEDFSLDFEEETEEIVDEHAGPDKDLEDFDVESGELVDDLEDFDLEIDEETAEETDDFSLEIEDETEAEAEALDELDDFALETEDEVAAEGTLDELEDFALETEDEASSEDTLDELEDFALETEDEISSEDTLDELEEFALETEDESASEDTLDELDSEHVSEDFDLETEDEISTEDTLDELDDFSLDTEEESASEDTFDELEDFDLGTPESTELPIDADDFELMEDFDDMDLSPEVIEASTDINDLPSMEIEEEILTPKSDFKKGEEVAPEISSLLEKAGVKGGDMSVAVINLKGLDLKKHYDLINNHFEGNSNIFELKSDQIAIALTDSDSNTAISEINDLIEKAQSQGLDMIAGISSMSGRRVGENRLMGEAVTAAEKAQEQSKELLAFKPDPKKYNDFIINS